MLREEVPQDRFYVDDLKSVSRRTKGNSKHPRPIVRPRQKISVPAGGHGVFSTFGSNKRRMQ